MTPEVTFSAAKTSRPALGVSGRFSIPQRPLGSPDPDPESSLPAFRQLRDRVVGTLLLCHGEPETQYFLRSGGTSEAEAGTLTVTPCHTRSPRVPTLHRGDCRQSLFSVAFVLIPRAEILVPSCIPKPHHLIIISSHVFQQLLPLNGAEIKFLRKI